DMDGNQLAYAQLKAGNSYKVRARIKDQNNYEFKIAFDGDVYTTDWQVFTVSENEQLYNPTDPNNPYYPQDPDASNPGTNPNNPGNNGGNGGGGSNAIKDFFDKLIANHFPLWQVIVMAVSALLAIIFIIKAAQYAGRAKKANNEAKKINARTYASLLPVFSGEIVALGFSNKVWSIMAFAFMGFAVAMLAVALILRHSWKKAELAKENAIENSEQRKRDAEKEAREAERLEREAEKQERREFQERIAQASQYGGDSNLEEILRQRDEAHRQELDTMKMMLANLMGRQQMDVDGTAYASMDDTDLLVQRVIAGLLPAMQDMIPEATAYLNAPEEQAEELMAIVEEQKAMMEEQKAIVEEQRAIVDEQNEEIRSMAEAHNEEMLNLTEAHNEELRSMTEAHNEEMLSLAEQHNKEMRNMAEVYNSDMQAMTAQMNELQQQLQMLALSNEKRDSLLLTDGSDDKMAEMADTMQQQLEKIEELQAQLSAMEQDRVDAVLLPDQSDDMKAMAEAMQAQLAKIDELQAQLAERPQTITNTVYVEREADDDDDDEGEEWDSVIDEEDDFVEAIAVDADGNVKKTLPNFRMRLKESSDKNREWYAAIKNLFCSQKGITY
ncbi:MAG: hypothetical protein K2N18_00085, partial [Clostridia bacterium]|nr:hypothetical protein [Clostridia bacterium]